MELLAGDTERGCAALVRDLQQRGMLDDTLVIRGGELGRTPMPQVDGRDHHIRGFSMWLAGGGIRGGTTWGATDELGYFAPRSWQSFSGELRLGASPDRVRGDGATGPGRPRSGGRVLGSFVGIRSSCGAKVGWDVDSVPYGPYSSVVAKLQRKRAEEARAKLPALLADAEKGRTTIITRRGRSVAALVPVQQVGTSRQLPLTSLAGSGKGMWGRDSATTVRRLREEWSR